MQIYEGQEKAEADVRRTGGLPPERVERPYRFRDISAYPFKKRLLIRAAGLVFYAVMKLTGLTTRFTVEGWENWEAASSPPLIPIYTAWHESVFLSTYFWRRRRIVVMSSPSVDAEYMARVINRFGYGTARGSSTRGGVGAAVEMVRLMRAGCPTGFTIDGPRGPRHVAKMGSVLVAKKTGNPVLPFVVRPARYWEIRKSWDGTQIPKPFTRALVSIAPPIFVPADADQEALGAKRDELQSALDQLSMRADEWHRAANGGE